MEPVTMKATVYAKQLRELLVVLKKKRIIDLKKYNTDVGTWRKDLHKWLDREAYDIIAKITNSELQGIDRRYGRNEPGFDTDLFFIGAPKPPVYPSDKTIRSIQSQLRHLAITGQNTIKVSENDTKQFFWSEDED
jgi:hypothetical protein